MRIPESLLNTLAKISEASHSSELDVTKISKLDLNNEEIIKLRYLSKHWTNLDSHDTLMIAKIESEIASIINSTI